MQAAAIPSEANSCFKSFSLIKNAFANFFQVFFW